jgi:hypothetical protein
MSNTVFLFAGEVITNGKTVPCVGLREPLAEPGTVPHGAAAIDSMTTIYGSNLPTVSEKGYVVRPVDRKKFTSAEQVAQAPALRRIGEVAIVPPMRVEQLVEIVGRDALRGIEL